MEYTVEYLKYQLSTVTDGKRLDNVYIDNEIAFNKEKLKQYIDSLQPFYKFKLKINMLDIPYDFYFHTIEMIVVIKNYEYLKSNNLHYLLNTITNKIIVLGDEAIICLKTPVSARFKPENGAHTLYLGKDNFIKVNKKLKDYLVIYNELYGFLEYILNRNVYSAFDNNKIKEYRYYSVALLKLMTEHCNLLECTYALYSVQSVINLLKYSTINDTLIDTFNDCKNYLYQIILEEKASKDEMHT